MRPVIIFGIIITLISITYRVYLSNTDDNEQDENRAYIASSENLLTLKNEKLIAPSGLAELTDNEVQIIKGEALNRFDQDTLILLAEIQSPRLGTESLQASDIFINEDNQTNKKKIYVSYNMRGAPFKGAVQIVEINKNIGQFPPKLLQTVVFNDFDVHSLTEKNGVLYLAGATGDNNFKTPAALEIIQLKNGLFPAPFESHRIDLPSFAATSVIKVKDKVFVTVGDKDGGVVEINNVQNIKDERTYYADMEFKLYDLDDARSLAYTENHIFALKGTNAALWVLDRKDSDALPAVFDLEGATIPESKSTIEISKDKVLLGLGDGGTQILNLTDLSSFTHIPQALHPSNNHNLSVTNAVSGQFKEIYTADGEAGMRVFDIAPDGQTNEIASINFGPGKSVNAIRYYDEFLVLASGLGGIKIAKLYRASEKLSGQENAYYHASEMSRLKDD